MIPNVSERLHGKCSARLQSDRCTDGAVLLFSDSPGKTFWLAPSGPHPGELEFFNLFFRFGARVYTRIASRLETLVDPDKEPLGSYDACNQRIALSSATNEQSIRGV